MAQPVDDPVLKKQYLMIGQLIVSTTPTEIITVLGSCVSVCLWDSEHRIGGINHYLLPEPPSSQYPFKHNVGSYLVEKLIEGMQKNGADLSKVEAKVFGGSSRMEQERDNFQVGARNVQLALSVLKKYEIKIKAKDTGGARGRKITFDTHTGLVKRILLKSYQY